jgi:hypothetical protein
MQDETVRERLAAYAHDACAHDAWAAWLENLFSKNTSKQIIT